MSIVTYYCGEDNLIRVSPDEGVSWADRSVSDPIFRTFYDIMAWPGQPDKATVVGELGSIYTTTDQGLTWNSASPVLGMDVTFEEVWNIDVNTSVVAGWRTLGPLATIPVFYKSIDGGVNYVQISIRDNVNLFIDIFKKGKATSIHFLTPMIGVIGIVGTIDILVGYPPPTIVDSLYVLMTLDGGTTWQVTSSNNPVTPITTIPWGIKLSYDTLSSEYIINVIASTNGYRSIDSGLNWSNYSVKFGRHLTWIGDSNVWYTEQTGFTINESLNIGASWVIKQAGIPLGGNAAHFYQNPTVITGFYSSGSDLMKTLDEGITGTLSDSTPLGEIIWAVWTEPGLPARCYMFEDCTNPDRQLVVQDWGCGNCVGICLSSTTPGDTFTITYQNTLGPVWCLPPEDDTCWRFIGEVTCPDLGGQLCIEQISVILP